MNTPAPGGLTEIKALIAERDKLLARHGFDYPGSPGEAEFNAAQDKLAARVPALAAALEAVLALADEWERRAAELSTGHFPAVALTGIRADALYECANRTKVAIESVLRDAQGGAGQ